MPHHLSILQFLDNLVRPTHITHTYFMKTLILITLITLLALVGTSTSAPVTLAWDANIEADIAGYELRYGGSSGNYSTALKAGKETEITVPDLTEGVTYYFVVFAYNAAGLMSGPSNEVVHTVDSTPTLPQTDMTVVAVSSEQADVNPGPHAIDGDPNTFWHCEWKTTQPKPPYEITISLGGTHTLSGFRYLPRQDDYKNGDIKDYEFYVSADGVAWGAPITGIFAPDKTRKLVTFPVPVTATHIRLKGLTDHSGIGYIAAAEIDVILVATPKPTPPASPTGFRVILKSSDNP